MLWITLHWVFLYICAPQKYYHFIVALLLVPFFKRKDLHVQNCLGVVCMYVGFYLSPHLWHFGFAPFWCVSIIGLRNNKSAVVIFAIVTGFVLNFLTLQDVAGHVVMNIGRFMRIREVDKSEMCAANFIIGLFSSVSIYYSKIYLSLREATAVASSLHMINKYERMDFFSLLMCYTHFYALLVPLLHSMLPHWYNYYENNHFYAVRRQYLFFIPICIIIQRIITATIV